MTKGTRNIVDRLRQHLKETEANIRIRRDWGKIPDDQKPPVEVLIDLPSLQAAATFLCMLRAEMRGKKHFQDPKRYLPQNQQASKIAPPTQREFITGGIERAQKWSHERQSTHPVLPKWLRATALAALAAADEEPKRRADRQMRLEMRKKQVAAGG